MDGVSMDSTIDSTKDSPENLSGDPPLSKERNRSRSFRLTLAALIEEIRTLIDSPEVPATGLCKNKVLSFSLKYIILKDIIKSLPHDNVYPSLNTSDLSQDSRCFIAFDSSFEIYYTSQNIARIVAEPQSFVMKSNLSRYLSTNTVNLLQKKCTGGAEELSLMLDLKRTAKSKKVYLKCKKYNLKTRTIWLGSCDMCSLSISQITKFTKNFFLDTHWSLYDLLINDSEREIDTNLRKLEAIKLMGLLHGYFSVDLDLVDRGTLCKGITIYSDDNFPVYFCGSIFSFNKFDLNNQISLQKSLDQQQENPYPLDYTIDKDRRYMVFTKMFCNYVRVKHGSDARIMRYLNLLLDPASTCKLLDEEQHPGELLILRILEQCFEELYEIHKTDIVLWRHLQTNIGFTASDIVIKDVSTLQPDSRLEQVV